MNGSTPLHWEGYNNLTETASFLTTNDADINTAQLGKLSPLHIVRRASNPEIVFVLVKTYSIGGSN